MRDPRLQLYGAGYTDLVCVAPPGAPIAARSKLNASDLGKRPGKRGDSGWYGYSWVTDQPTQNDIERWAEWDANVGLRGTNFPALDIDSTDETLTAVVKKLAKETLGPAPVRVGKAPKTLLVYRTEEPFSRVAVEIERGGETHLVEFLGHGRQYLVYGKHPCGSDYTWEEEKLWDIVPADLPVITGADAERFLTVLEEKLTGVGLKVHRVGRASAVHKDAPEQSTLLAPSIEALGALVQEIPNDDSFSDRDDYITFGHAIKAAAGEEDEDGYLIYSTWAARWTGGDNDPDTVRSDWRRMHPPFRVGWSWLLEQAEGFTDAEWEFDADPTAVPPPVKVGDPGLPFPVECTDDWITEQILSEVILKLRFDVSTGRWHVWDGTRWATDDSQQHVLLVTYALRRLAGVLTTRIQSLTEKERKRYNAVIVKLGNVATIRAVSTLLESHLAVGVDTFDQEGMQLNTPGGTVDLVTGEMRPADPAQMHSKVTSVAPGAAEAPVWEKFLKEVTGGDEALARFMQKQAGYALTGVRREQTLSFVWGPGGNGKSVFVDALMGVLGDYAATAPMDTFASSRGDKHPTDLAGLMGARLVTATETQAGRSWDEQRLKSITGGDRLRARFMRQDFVEFTPRFKLLMVGNHEPQIDNVDDAMRRRIHIVPFTFKPEVPDLDLPEKLKAEYPAILRWMIEGCKMWQSEGLEPPECVLTQTEEYFDEEDIMGQWLAECCKVEKNETMASADAYRSWQIWCSQRGEVPVARRTFARSMKPYEQKLGFKKGQVGDKRLAGWHGIRLTDDSNSIQGDIV